MQSLFHLQPRVLILMDGDDLLMKQVSHVFGGTFKVLQIHNPRRAIGLIESDPQVAAVITEQVLNAGDGVELLESIRTLRPEVRRVMLTSYSDLASIVAGLHSGAIQQLLQKPINDVELLLAVCPEMTARTTMARSLSA